MSYKHLTLNDRNKIDVLNQEGYYSRRIAKILGFHHPTISRELKRCDNEYETIYAQKDKIKKSSSKGRKPKTDDNITKSISEKLHKKWSPEQIANTICKDIVCFKKIYKWIYSGIIYFDISKLRRKGKSRKPKETRGRFNIGKSINKRPEEVKKRNTFGNWELDTVVSSRGKSKGCLATFVERKTRFYIALPMIDRSKNSMLKAIDKQIKSLPLEALKTFTSDIGKEFACYEDVEKLVINFYFADAYSAWQRAVTKILMVCQESIILRRQIYLKYLLMS